MKGHYFTFRPGTNRIKRTTEETVHFFTSVLPQTAMGLALTGDNGRPHKSLPVLCTDMSPFVIQVYELIVNGEGSM